MNAPLTRDQQIELIKGSKTRHDALVANWIADSTIKGVLSRPAKGQEQHGYTVEDVVEDAKVLACG